MIAQTLRWLADRIDPPLAEEPTIAIGDTRVPPYNAIVNDEECSARNEAAMRLVDDTTLGYLIFVVERDLAGAHVSRYGQLARGVWPGVASAMARTLLTHDDRQVPR